MKVNVTLFIAAFYFIALPLGLFVWWKKRSGAKLWCFLAGAICFALFALVLEKMLHSVCLMADNSVSRFILGSPAAFVLYASLAAGFFEETGRMFGYKLLLGGHRESSCAVAYGIGHGGIEVLLLVGINYVVFFLASLGLPLGSESEMTQVLSLAESITFAQAGVAMLERLSAMMLHIGLSMIVFVAAKQKGKLWLYPLAILLHALADAPAGLYQYQGTPSVAVIEVFAFLCGLAYLLIGKKLLSGYKTEETNEVLTDVED